MARPLSDRHRQILHALSMLHLTGQAPVATVIGAHLDPPLAGKHLHAHLRRLERARKIERYGRTTAGILWRRTPS
jgi:hypothetical protein